MCFLLQDVCLLTDPEDETLTYDEHIEGIAQSRHTLSKTACQHP
jgi:hypothetical protein